MKKERTKTIKRKENLQAIEEIDVLANFLLRNFRDEIGKGNLEIGESAVDVAIRLLKKLKALEELLD